MLQNQQRIYKAHRISYSEGLLAQMWRIFKPSGANLTSEWY